VRFVLLALVAANIVFFAWARWIDAPPRPPAAVAHDTAVPPLQLEPATTAGAASAPTATGAGPPPPASTAAPSATGPIATTPTPGSGAARGASGPVIAAAQAGGNATIASAGNAAGGRCRTLGPFDDSNLANAVADRLRTRGLSPHDRSVESTNPNVYWVYIGELTSDAQRRAIQTLNAAGIHDAASMTQPEQSDRLSVGVFADQAHAVRRAEQVRSLGFKPTLGMRQRTVTTHWVDFELKGSETEPSATELIGPTSRAGIGLGPPKVADCPGAAGSG
jgi:hypothetical protein